MRSASPVYEQLLGDPSPADTMLRPLETMAVMITPQPDAYDRWLLAGYHISMNVLDNPILDAAKGSLYRVGGAAAVAGLLGGFLFGRRRRA